MNNEQRNAREAERKTEEALKKAMSTEVACAFCKENGLSVDKLRQQLFFWIAGTAYFAQPSDIEPRGLTNDMETMPLPTLVIKSKNGSLEIQKTEHTQKYLGI